MKNREFRFHDGQSGAAITVRVAPRSSRNEIIEILSDGTVHVRLASHAAGQTNQALLKFLAEILEVSPAQLEIIGGANGSNKLVSILNLDGVTVQERIVKRVS